jgi:alanyl-tRNA synthetase
MTSHEIRKAFLDFFASKQHKIVPSAPLVLKNDPTLMFTNSGMVQFKDYFLGNGTPPSVRIADTQKCLRVSGKHNDLEDVGFDGTHHTLFEMLGNWSFGDYFKKEAIAWSWELLHDKLGLPADRLYATVFGGDEKEGLASDEEARNFWRQYLPDNQILDGNKKDNFWEMGAQGPCGPCSEIHFDFRSDEERAKVAGEKLVNQDDPSVVEIWNNVFMQFERKADGSLVVLPAQHVDTGMGFERLCMVLQGKKFTYDTDIFTPFIQLVEQESGKKYTGSYDRNAKTDVAMRVIVDHIRAVAFTIGDGQLPSSNGAGYVIRRILRRAVRYYYSFLDIKEPFLQKLIPLLATEFQDVFPELKAQQDFVQKVILEEERSFLRTLELGLKRFDSSYTKAMTLEHSVHKFLINNNISNKLQYREQDIGIDIVSKDYKVGIELKLNPDKHTIKNFNEKIPFYKEKLDLKHVLLVSEDDFLSGRFSKELSTIINKDLDNKYINLELPSTLAFEFYDTFGFPIDLTELIASEKGLSVDTAGFDAALLEQKQRSKKDAEKQVGDWVTVIDEAGVEFVGYDQLKVENAKVLKYRAVTDKKGLQYQIVLNRTPFYAESGGQVGDTGAMYFDGEKIAVLDTKKENDLIIHIVNDLPENILDPRVRAQVDKESRQAISQNHTAVHLMHAALHAVLGKHAVQKGQNVDSSRLRFDFSHFQGVSKEELTQIETIVNQKIRENITLHEVRNMPIEDARKTGAMMLFGEKYGETVRVITFDKNFSQELCGGTHVQATGEIGLFKIIAESAVAAGVRRIEAVTADGAEAFMNSEKEELDKIRDIFKNPKETAKKVDALMDENKALRKQIEGMFIEQAASMQKDLRSQFVVIANDSAANDGVKLLIKQIGLSDNNAVKTLATNLEKEVGNAVIVFGTISNDKPQLTICISPDLAKAKNWNAGAMVKELAKDIKGGGGGQPTFATAGGTDTEGLASALARAKNLLN